jgi:N-acetylneuraminic acid mutarotase
MKLTVQKSAWREAGTNYSKTTLARQTCCAEMKAAWDDGFIGYGNHEDDDAQDNENINIYKYDPDEESWSALSIQYCPFCGASIEIVHAS